MVPFSLPSRWHKVGMCSKTFQWLFVSRDREVILQNIHVLEYWLLLQFVVKYRITKCFTRAHTYILHIHIYILNPSNNSD